MPVRRPHRPAPLVTAVALAAGTLLVVPPAHAAAPTASVVVADTALAAGETSVVTITFSEDVLDFTLADMTAANGTLSSLVTSDTGTTWTATLTPTADIEDTTNVIVLDQTGVTDASSTPGVGTATSNNYAIDTLRPTSSVVVTDTALAAGETSPVTITFNEPVTGLTSGDFTVANGALSMLSSSDGGITWTATLTPTASIEDTTNVIALDNTGYTDAAGNTGTGSTNSNNYAIDTLRPSVASIVVDDTSLNLAKTSPVYFTFSEAVSGFTSSDLTVANGSVSAPWTMDGGITWTGTLTPDAGVEDATNIVTLDNTGVVDAAGNAGTGSTDSNNYAVDTVRPTPTIVVADAALAAGETSLVTFTFNESVTGFTNADLTIANATLTAVSSSDGGVTWTATLTPSAGIEDTTNLITLDNTGVVDAGGNYGSGTTDSNNYAIDTLRPTASIVVADTALAAGETSLVTLTFSEAVTGLTLGDLTVANGSLSGLSSSDGGITWTATLTPTAGIEDTTNVIALDNTGVVDAAGNAGTGSTDSNNYAIDTLRPAASIVVDDTSLTAGETSPVTFTFTEAVTGFTNADLTIANGTLSAVSSSDGGITWTATLTPTAGIADPTNVITLADTGVTDAAGNTGTGTTDSNNYAIDTRPPFVPATAVIDLSDTELAVGETSLVTVTFSRAVTGVDNGDLSAPNATLSPVSSTDGGLTWTATLTPLADVEDDTNRVVLDNSGVAGAGSGETRSFNYEVDTLRPTATIEVADDELTFGETSAVTFTFSEPVSGLTAADLAVASGQVGDLASSDGGTTWTGVLTPAADTVEPSNVIELDGSGVRDDAGNSAAGTVVSNAYAVDTTPPDVEAPTSRSTGPVLTGDRNFTVSYTASDADSGVASVELYVRKPGRSSFVPVAVDEEELDGAFTYRANRDGRYAFYTIATDHAGNVEAAPARRDHRTRVDRTAPVVEPATPGALAFDPRADRRIRVVFSVSERVSYEMVIMRGGERVQAFDERMSGRNFLRQSWRGRDQAGERVAPGRYRVVVKATDRAGNRSTASQTVLVAR